MNIISSPPLPLFDPDSPGDVVYVACRDSDIGRPTRERLEQAWARVWQLCPEGASNFVEEFRRSFHARAWELYLLDVLSAAGLALEPAPGKGPDICARLPSGRRCWIEAVAPTPGSGDNAVVQHPPDGRAHALPKDTNLILRYRQALEEKWQRLETYRSAGIVKTDDAYVIAVYQGAIDNGDLYDNELPGMARAVFPLGDTVLTAPVGGVGPLINEVVRRNEVRKVNKAPVSTTFFLEPRTEFVSGVLFAREAVWNLEWSAAKSLGMIHRPGARVPVPRGSIPVRCEMWVSDDGGLRHRGRCAMYGPFSKEV